MIEVKRPGRPRGSYTNTTPKIEAKKLYLEVDETGVKHKYTLKEIHQILKKKFGDKAPKYKTLWAWKERYEWEKEFEIKVIDERARLLKEAEKSLGDEDELERKRKELDRTLKRAVSYIVISQLELAKKLNEIIKAMSPQHPKFIKLAQLTDKVNQTAWEMLKDLGYRGTEEAVGDRPIIIVNEIGGKQLIITGGPNGEKKEAGQSED